MVGRYPTLSGTTVTSSRVRMLTCSSVRAMIHTRFFSLAGWTTACVSTSILVACGGSSHCPALYMSSISGGVLIRLFFVLSTEGRTLDGCGSPSLVWTAIP